MSVAMRWAPGRRVVRGGCVGADRRGVAAHRAGPPGPGPDDNQLSPRAGEGQLGFVVDPRRVRVELCGLSFDFPRPVGQRAGFTQQLVRARDELESNCDVASVAGQETEGVRDRDVGHLGTELGAMFGPGRVGDPGGRR